MAAGALDERRCLAPLWLAGAVGPFVDRRLADVRAFSRSALCSRPRSIFSSAAPITICFRSIRRCSPSARSCASGSASGSRAAGSLRRLLSSALFAPVALPILEPRALAALHGRCTGIRPAADRGRRRRRAVDAKPVGRIRLARPGEEGRGGRFTSFRRKTRSASRSWLRITGRRRQSTSTAATTACRRR